MTPGARAQAAIEVLDRYLSGQAVEKALTNWARGARYAGSGDRAAVRDIVFDCVRRRKSYGFRAQLIAGMAPGPASQAVTETGRALVLAHFCDTGAENISALFSGARHAPAPLTGQELQNCDTVSPPASWSAAHDLPSWMERGLGTSDRARLEEISELLRQRAPVFLRVNCQKADVAAARAALLCDEIEVVPSPLADHALEVVKNPRRLANSNAYQTGMVELQDAASQALCEGLPFGARFLDYCAGGGGKTLAYGARYPQARLFAHDVSPTRLSALTARAARAGVEVRLVAQHQHLRAHGPFGVILCDVPCSGSGAWRRSPDGKWQLTRQKLDQLLCTQADILRTAAPLVAHDGYLIYVTCSVLEVENEEQISDFMQENPTWRLEFSRRYSPSGAGDGFFVAHLKRA